ncbi:uncharacterized protein LOC111377117 [Olea europaea var. sylvestris]|uniref:uncharacterized protein LOC111377117 n=1 Tax=Olea europaea var. sylvestris TaxID=158386 RepID=UPI000C1D08D6|nr:uncharacterized protein LOC111377117 [Olea europaea var. sylvestris]
MGRREERFATKRIMNSPEVGEVDDRDVEFVCHLRGSLRKLVYGENSAYFTIRLNHGGMIFSKMRNYVYEHGKINYLDYVDPYLFNRFLLDNAMKMLSYKERMRYIYRLEKKRLSEGSFWLVTDADFMNVVKWVGPTRVADMYFLPIHTTVLELLWDENVPTGCIVIDIEIGEILESVCQQ